jgi:hypothetical protein
MAQESAENRVLTKEDIELELLEIERKRFKLEELKFKADRKIINKHLSIILTTIISIAALAVSYAQVWIAKISKDKELEVQRIELAQKIIPTLFDDNAEKAFAIEPLLAKVVEGKEAEDIHNRVAKYYENKIDNKIKEGQIETASEIVSAAKSIGGPAADRVVQSVKQDSQKVQKIENYRLTEIDKASVVSRGMLTAPQAYRIVQDAIRAASGFNAGISLDEKLREVGIIDNNLIALLKDQLVNKALPNAGYKISLDVLNIAPSTPVSSLVQLVQNHSTVAFR